MDMEPKPLNRKRKVLNVQENYEEGRPSEDVSVADAPFGWDEVVEADVEDVEDEDWRLRDPEESLSDESRALLKEFEEEFGTKLSKLAFEALRVGVLDALRRAEWNWKRGKAGNFRAYAGVAVNSARKKFIKHYRWGRLQREREDSEKIERARQGGDGLTDYMEHAVKRILKQASLFPTRWRVPGWNMEDLARDLAAAIATGFLIPSQKPAARQRVRRTSSGRAQLPVADPLLEPLYIAHSEMRIGREATVVAASRRRTQLYKRAVKELNALHELAPTMEPMDVLSPEEILIQAEEPEVQEPLNPYTVLFEAGLVRLTSIQRGWLEAFKADFEQHGELNLARAGETLSKPRSRYAASRAWTEIKGRLAGDLPPRTRREMAQATAHGRLTAANATKERR
jgi:hypothetical protein